MTKDVEPEWYDEIIKSNPKLFKEVQYFECSEGWKDLLKVTSKTIEQYINTLPPELEGEVFATQIKSKFGGLRFYMSHQTPYIDGVISLAEKLSYCYCEDCGASSCGSKITGFSRTVCQKHFEEYSGNSK